MPSSSKIFAPLLALMMVGDARAADPAKFTTKAALKAAVTTCLNNFSPVGNCCAQNDNPATIVAGMTANDGTCSDPNTHTHLQNWDVSQVTSMYQSELCVISIDVFPYRVSLSCVAPSRSRCLLV